jgi:hypothetical protein
MECTLRGCMHNRPIVDMDLKTRWDPDFFKAVKKAKVWDVKKRK